MVVRTQETSEVVFAISAPFSRIEIPKKDSTFPSPHFDIYSVEVLSIKSADLTVEEKANHFHLSRSSITT